MWADAAMAAKPTSARLRYQFDWPGDVITPSGVPRVPVGGSHGKRVCCTPRSSCQVDLQAAQSLEGSTSRLCGIK